MVINRRTLTLFLCLNLFFVLVLFPIRHTASAAISIEENEDVYSLIPQLEWLVDETKQLSLDEVTSKTFSKIPVKSQTNLANEFSLYNMGFASSAYWFKFDLINNTRDGQMLLALKGYPHAFKSIKLFIFHEGKQIHFLETGSKFPFYQREIRNRNFILPLPLKPQESVTAFMRVETDVMMMFNLFLYSPRSFYERDHREQMIMGVFSGIIIAMILYNLFLYLSTKEKNLLFYVFFLMSTELYHLALSGQGYELVWSSFPRFNYYAVLIASWLVAAMFANFANHYLQTFTYVPVLNRINNILILTSLGFAFMTPFINVFFNDWAVKVTITITFLISLWAFLVAFKKGYKHAIYFPLSWGLFSIGAIIFILATYQVLPLNMITNASFRIGLVFGVILLSFGMADKINALDKEKRLAQKEALSNKQLAIDYLQKSKDRIKQILNHAIEGIFQFSEDRKLVFVNPSMSKLFGYPSPEDMIQQVDSIESLWEKPENQQSRISDVFSNDDLLEFETKLFREDGTFFWGIVSVQMIQDRTNSGVFAEGMVLDITDRKQKIDAERQKKAAEDANRLKSDLLANISHDLKTPLHGVLSFSNLGLRKLEKIDLEAQNHGKLRRYFENIQKSGFRLIKLLNEILDLSKLEAGKTDFHFSDADLSDQILIAAAEVSSLLSEKNIRIDYEPPIQGVRLAIDTEKIVRVVINLLSNAIKFSPPDSTIVVDLITENDFATVQVKDQGVGIPDNELKFIFNRYAQSSKTKTIPGGTGLGLAICREIIVAHKGKIWATNNANQGAIFSFQIPFDILKESRIA